jgi:hypothetical protein
VVALQLEGLGGGLTTPHRKTSNLLPTISQFAGTLLNSLHAKFNIHCSSVSLVATGRLKAKLKFREVHHVVVLRCTYRSS